MIVFEFCSDPSFDRAQFDVVQVLSNQIEGSSIDEAYDHFIQQTFGNGNPPYSIFGREQNASEYVEF